MAKSIAKRLEDRVSRVKWKLRTRRAKRNRTKLSATAICITGSSGKSTTSALLAHILAGHGETLQYDFSNNLHAVVRLLNRLKRKHEFVVAEVGVGFGGPLRQVMDVFQPDISIVTLIGRDHYSLFRSLEAIAAEKSEIISALRPDGLAVLNADDPLTMAMGQNTAARAVTIGRENDADYRVCSSGFGSAGLELSIRTPTGDIDVATPFLADHFWLATVATVAVACELGVPEAVIRERIRSFEPRFGRFQQYRTTEGPAFVLDTAKAPHETLDLAIAAFGRLKAPRKRIVLGQVSDFSAKPRDVYRNAYRSAREAADQVIFVGEHAHRSRAGDEDRAAGRFLEFATVREVSDYLRADATSDDLILLKSSANLHLERIALDWDEPVRCWLSACGITKDCLRCGMVFHPPDEHRAIRRRQRLRRNLRRLLPSRR